MKTILYTLLTLCLSTLNAFSATEDEGLTLAQRAARGGSNTTGERVEHKPAGMEDTGESAERALHFPAAQAENPGPQIQFTHATWARSAEDLGADIESYTLTIFVPEETWGILEGLKEAAVMGNPAHPGEVKKATYAHQGTEFTYAQLMGYLEATAFMQHGEADKAYRTIIQQQVAG